MTKTNEKNTVVESVQEMDSVVGSLQIRAGVLHDVSEKFTAVVDDMNNAVYTGDEMVYYREHFQELRVLSELLRYCMNDVSTETEKMNSLTSSMFKEVVKKGDEKS